MDDKGDPQSGDITLSEKKQHSLVIKPAIPPEHRHKLEDALKASGYHVSGGGTCADMSECDISFDALE